MTNDIKAINQFITHRIPGDRLVIRNKELQVVKKSTITGWEWIQAKFGYGNASMRKVATYINKHRNDLFPEDNKTESIRTKTILNKFFKRYSDGTTFSCKKAKQIRKLKADSILFFGPKDWKKIGYKIKDAPPIPAGLDQLYSIPCTIWPDKTIADTHILFLVPKMLKNKETTINRLGKLVDKYCAKKGSRTYQKIVKEKDGHDSIKGSYWVLMCKEVIPDSLDMEYSDVQIPANYKIPRVIEAVIAALTQYLRGKNLTYKSKFILNNFTWCKEVNEDGQHPNVGACKHESFSLFFPRGGNSSYCTGIAPVQRL